MKQGGAAAAQAVPKRVREARPESTAEGEVKQKRKRGPRSPSTFANDVKALAAKYRAKLGKLDGPKQELEKKLANIMQQYQEAETILRDVEEMLSRVPGLPGIEGTPEAAPAPEPAPPVTPELESEAV